MNKPSQPKVEPLRHFYRPHRRSATWYTGLLEDPHTGELVQPVRRVKQSFVPECDINNILKQYKLTGQIRHISNKAAQGAYQDLPDNHDFQDAMNLVLAAQASFATLPSHVRARFLNSPAEFLAFMADPSNQDEMIKLGLATDTRTPEPPPAPPPKPDQA